MTSKARPLAGHGAQPRGMSAGANDGQPFGRFGRMFNGLLWLDRDSFLHAARGFRPLQAISGGGALTLGRHLSFALS